MTSSSSAELRRVLLGLTVALSVVPLSGCYTTHVVLGQLSILAGRESLEDVLEKPGLAPDAREKLELVRDVRAFAIERLGLDETGSFTSVYDTGDRPVAWNVSASDPDAFAAYMWSFPVVGDMPYIGYFDEDLARAEGVRLRKLGLDALVLPVPAYSTLGWFDDPFFSSMLRYDEATIAEIVIHELAHGTVFIDGDADFNETLATFIGQRGAEAFFLQRGGEHDPALAASREDQRQETIFNRELKALQDALWRIYESSGTREEKLERKTTAIAGWRKRFVDDVRPLLTDSSYDFVLEEKVEFNNAFLLAFDRYHGDLDVFQELWEHDGRDLPATIRVLVALAEEDDPRAALDERVAAARRLRQAPVADHGCAPGD